MIGIQEQHLFNYSRMISRSRKCAITIVICVWSLMVIFLWFYSFYYVIGFELPLPCHYLAGIASSQGTVILAATRFSDTSPKASFTHESVDSMKSFINQMRMLGIAVPETKWNNFDCCKLARQLPGGELLMRWSVKIPHWILLSPAIYLLIILSWRYFGRSRVRQP